MGYRANAELQDLFDEGPMVRSCKRIAERCAEKLKDGAARRTPISKPPPGVGQTEFAALRGRVPGTMKVSWYADSDVSITVINGTRRFSAEAATDDPQAPHVEWPTRPHIIRPRADRGAASVIATQGPRRMGTDPEARLRFVNSHGRVIFASEVHHPGTQGVHMMRDSLAELDGTWVSTIGAEEVERWAREQARVVR